MTEPTVSSSPHQPCVVWYLNIFKNEIIIAEKLTLLNMCLQDFFDLHCILTQWITILVQGGRQLNTIALSFTQKNHLKPPQL